MQKAETVERFVCVCIFFVFSFSKGGIIQIGRNLRSSQSRIKYKVI